MEKEKQQHLVRGSAFKLYEKLMPYFVIVFEFVEHHRLSEGPDGLKTAGRNVWSQNEFLGGLTHLFRLTLPNLK